MGTFLFNEKVLTAFFRQNRGREGPERFTKLNLRVQMILHLRRIGLAQNAAITEGPWPKLSAPLVPADDSPSRLLLSSFLI